jgi:hypothetical protein
LRFGGYRQLLGGLLVAWTWACGFLVVCVDCCGWWLPKDADCVDFAAWTCDSVGLLIVDCCLGLLDLGFFFFFFFCVLVAILVGCWLLFDLSGFGLADQQAWLLFGGIGLAVQQF